MKEAPMDRSVTAMTPIRLLAGAWPRSAAALLLAAAGSAFAAETPPSLAGVTVISAEQARRLADGGVPLFDTRVANEYAQEHIKGARSLPYKEKSAKDASFDAKEDSFDLTKLPPAKAAPVIFYCNAGECWKSYKASKVAAAAGYTKVHWLRGGIPEWKAKGYPVE
jgi:rhodanese-related sulfurtransferase